MKTMNNLDALLKIEKNVRGAIEVSKLLLPKMNKSQRRAWDRQILIHLKTIEANINDLKKRKDKITTEIKDETFGGLISFD